MAFKKTLAVLLAASVLSVPAYAQNAPDTAGHWAEETIGKWMDLGIVSGYPDGSFKPDAPVTRAEFVKMIDSVFGLQPTAQAPFSDVDAGDWFYDAVNEAYADAIVQGDGGGIFRPKDEISRQEAAVVLANAFRIQTEEAGAYVNFHDKDLVAAWSAEAVNALVGEGYMNGRDGNLLAPLASLTRAEAAKLIDNMAVNFITEAGTYTEDYAGNVLVNAADVVLEGIRVDGNLYIGQGVGEGDVYLRGVEIAGELVVLGGGVDSVYLEDTTVGKLSVDKVRGEVRIVVVGETSVGEVVVSSGAILEEQDLTGDGFASVQVIEVKEGQTLVLVGDFETVVVEGAVAGIEITGGTIGNLVLNEPVAVTGDGSIETMTINTTGVTTTIEPETLATDLSEEEAEEITVAIVDEDGDVVSEEPVVEEEAPVLGGGGGGGGTTTPATVTKTFNISTGGTTEPITITASETAGYNVILKEVLLGIQGDFSTYYGKYASGDSDPISLLFFSGLNVLNEATTDILSGTVFSGINLDAGEEAVMEAALQAAITNLDTTGEALAMKEDLVEIAAQVALRDISYGDPGQPFQSITVSGGDMTAYYAAGESKADFINAFYIEAATWTMDSSGSYEVAAVLQDDTTKTGTITF